MAATDAQDSAGPSASSAPAAALDVRPVHAGALLSSAALIIGIALLLATFLLISPARERTYPGAIPWSDFSILRPLTQVLALGGLAATERGTEIKDFALHLAGVAGLLLLTIRAAAPGFANAGRRQLGQPWLAAQLLLGAWVVLSAASALWAGDPNLAFGQAALYAFALGWALVLAWTLTPRDADRLLSALVVASALAGLLCIWYFHERNPHHRPGFPVGNPATLSAAILPAILVAIGVLVGAGAARLRRAPALPLPIVLAAGAALVPLGWCFRLAGSRAAIIGLVVGLATMCYLRAGRRLRWLMVAGLLVLAGLGGTWLLSHSTLDATMARGATIRFRLYAWRYAAELWEQSWLTAIVGQGAGQYPRLAAQLALRDRSLDPSAFMDAEFVEHAHNEFFEILTEIGLVGGITFLAGCLATLVAGSVLVRRAPPGPQRWLQIGLVAAIAALMTDSFLSPGLRLAGVPAVFYTLIGLVWARARAGDDTSAAAAAGPRRQVLAGVALLLALALGYLAVRNWVGACREEAAHYAYVHGDHAATLHERALASQLVLDPVRQLINHGRAVRAQLALAQYGAYAYAAARQAGAAAGELDRLRIRTAEDAAAAYHAARHFNQRAPTLMYSAGIGAIAAELLAELQRESEPDQAALWEARAVQAWRLQRAWRPDDFETLLALLHYGGTPPAYRLSLLRDALRATHGYDRRERYMPLAVLRARWQESLRQLAAEPGVAELVPYLQAAVGPLTPESDLDTLIASRAPEIHRLGAHFRALAGDYAAGAEFAALAANLYAPARLRFPELPSIALLEQAEFMLRGRPAHAAEAVEILREAIALLPEIQKHKYEVHARPLLLRLGLAQLAAGQRERAVQTIQPLLAADADPHQALAGEAVSFATLDIRQPAERRPPVTFWLELALQQQPDHLFAWSWLAWLAAETGDAAAVDACLGDAAQAGVAEEDITWIRRSLAREFPMAFDPDSAED
jgi:O-antigen ligase